MTPTPKAKVMAALGNNIHLFARPHRRNELIWCFETVLGCGPVASVPQSSMAEPMLLIYFPGGGYLSIEFIEEAPDADAPRLGAWLELRAESWHRGARSSPSRRRPEPDQAASDLPSPRATSTSQRELGKHCPATHGRAAMQVRGHGD
jgi:hypothetical protein